MAPQSTDRKDVQERLPEVSRRVAELERELEARKAAAATATSPASTAAAVAPPAPAQAAAVAPPAPAQAIAAAAPPLPSLLAVELDGGMSALHLEVRGAAGWDQPVLAMLRVGGRWRLPWARRRFELGLSASAAPLEYWDQRGGGERRRSLLTGLLVPFAARVPLGARTSAGGELAAGLLWWSGLGAGNPITGAAEGIVTLPTARVGGALTRELAAGVSVSVRAGYTVSLPRGTAIAPRARRLDQLELLLGLAYSVF
jgi:hypothetical protein